LVLKSEILRVKLHQSLQKNNHTQPKKPKLWFTPTSVGFLIFTVRKVSLNESSRTQPKSKIYWRH
jgi:hypothetical protein